MCTRPAPSYRSVTASAAALGISVLDLIRALALLLAAIAVAPGRRLRHVRKPWRTARSGHVNVQVHLGDAACVAELEAIVWKTLARAERTWAPLPLPLDRVVVGAGFPAAGRADIYDDFLEMSDINRAEATGQRRRVVVSLGVRDGARDLDGWEIAGALAAQIQVLIDEQCRQHRSLSVPPAVAQAATRLARPSAVEGQEASTRAVADNAHPATAASATTGEAPPAEVPSLAELLATVQKGQPLVAAGPSSNGTHP